MHAAATLYFAQRASAIEISLSVKHGSRME